MDESCSRSQTTEQMESLDELLMVSLNKKETSYYSGVDERDTMLTANTNAIWCIQSSRQPASRRELGTNDAIKSLSSASHPRRNQHRTTSSSHSF